MTVSFVSHHQSPKVKQPADTAFHFPASRIASQSAAILSRWLDAVLAMRTHQFDLAFRQLSAQRITVRRPVIDQTVRIARQHLPIQQRLDQFHLRRRGTGSIQREREPVSVDQQHKLGSLSSFRLANVSAPFFAGQNVPSPNASDQTISLRRSICSRSRCQAASKIPASVHSLNRRQQVLGDGKYVGKSFHRAPVLNTQRIPSRQSRGATRGRPPAIVMGGSGNRSSIRSHCSSESCGFGSVLDPVMLRPLLGVDTRVMVMVRPPFWRESHAKPIPSCSVI